MERIKKDNVKKKVESVPKTKKPRKITKVLNKRAKDQKSILQMMGVAQITDGTEKKQVSGAAETKTNKTNIGVVGCDIPTTTSHGKQESTSQTVTKQESAVKSNIGLGLSNHSTNCWPKSLLGADGGKVSKTNPNKKLGQKSSIKKSKENHKFKPLDIKIETTTRLANFSIKKVPPNEKKKTGTELFQVLAPLNNNLKIEDRVLLPVARAKSTKEGATLNKEIQVFGVGSQKYVPKHMAKNRYKPQIDEKKNTVSLEPGSQESCGKELTVVMANKRKFSDMSLQSSQGEKLSFALNKYKMNERICRNFKPAVLSVPDTGDFAGPGPNIPIIKFFGQNANSLKVTGKHNTDTIREMEGFDISAVLEAWITSSMDPRTIVNHKKYNYALECRPDDMVGGSVLLQILKLFPCCVIDFSSCKFDRTKANVCGLFAKACGITFAVTVIYSTTDCNQRFLSEVVSQVKAILPVGIEQIFFTDLNVYHQHKTKNRQAKEVDPSHSFAWGLEEKFGALQQNDEFNDEKHLLEFFMATVKCTSHRHTRWFNGSDLRRHPGYAFDIHILEPIRT